MPAAAGLATRAAGGDGFTVGLLPGVPCPPAAAVVAIGFAVLRAVAAGCVPATGVRSRLPVAIAVPGTAIVAGAVVLTICPVTAGTCATTVLTVEVVVLADFPMNREAAPVTTTSATATARTSTTPSDAKIAPV